MIDSKYQWYLSVVSFFFVIWQFSASPIQKIEATELVLALIFKLTLVFLKGLKIAALVNFNVTKLLWDQLRENYDIDPSMYSRIAETVDSHQPPYKA